MAKKHGLGKGIESLLGDYTVSPVKKQAEFDGNRVVEIDINAIRTNVHQPRKSFDKKELESLAVSIANQGVLQPVLVEKIVNNVYSIVAGERRYRAAKIAGLHTIPVIIRSFTDIERMEVSLIENIQREDLNPIEEAQAFAALLRESGMTQEQLAERVGKSRSAIANSVRLLQLPSVMRKDLVEGSLNAGQARAILSVVNPAEQQLLYKRILSKGLSVREAERLASDYNKGKRVSLKRSPKKETAGEEKTLEMIEVEEKFLQSFGTKVEIRGCLESGVVEIPFDSIDELERIYQLVNSEASLFDIEEF